MKYAQLGAIAFVLGAGRPACDALGVTLPDSVWTKLQESKAILVMGTW